MDGDIEILKCCGEYPVMYPMLASNVVIECHTCGRSTEKYWKLPISLNIIKDEVIKSWNDSLSNKIDEERALRAAWQEYRSCMGPNGCPQYKIDDVIRVLYMPEPDFIGTDEPELVPDSLTAKHILFKLVAKGEAVDLVRI